MLPLLKRDALRMAVDLCSETGDPNLVMSVAQDMFDWMISNEVGVEFIPAERPEGELN